MTRSPGRQEDADDDCEDGGRSLSTTSEAFLSSQ